MRIIEAQVVCLTAAMPLDVRQVSDLVSDLPGNAEQKFRAAPALRGIAPIVGMAVHGRPQAFRTSGGSAAKTLL